MLSWPPVDTDRTTLDIGIEDLPRGLCDEVTHPLQATDPEDLDDGRSRGTRNHNPRIRARAWRPYTSMHGGNVLGQVTKIRRDVRLPSALPSRVPARVWMRTARAQHARTPEHSLMYLEVVKQHNHRLA
jgi:hypothetical protein